MELKKKKISGWEVDYDDWDRFVNKYFGFEMEKYCYPYEFVVDIEANNYSMYEFNPDIDINESVIKKVEKWANDPKSDNWMTHEIFDYLLYKGEIPEGTYYISVSW